MHLPCPSHALGVRIAPLHVESHVVLVGGYVHAIAFAPSHLPPHAPAPSHFARAPCGAPETVVHTPALPCTSQAWHWPSHLESQHKPSTQLPDPHCPFAVHAPPFPSLGAHLPFAAQNAVGAQSGSAAHDVAHLPDVQRYGEQSTPVDVLHCPPPLQTCPVTWLLVHDVTPQATPLCAYGRHAPLPSQLPSAKQSLGKPGSAAHWL
jgi:hypothetical protein